MATTNNKVKEPVTHNIYLSNIHEQFPDDAENKEMYLEFCKINDLDVPEDETELNNKINDYLYETNDMYFSDLRAEIHAYERKNGTSRYVIQGDVGLWHGRREGYVVCNGLMNAITKMEGDIDVFVKDNKLRVICSHHDGVNYAHIRVLTKLGEAYYNNHIDDVDMSDFELFRHLFNSNRLSKEVRVFHEMYGWKD